MSVSENIVGILLVASTTSAALSFGRLSLRFNVAKSPPLKWIALVIGWLALGRVAAYIDLALFGGPGQPLWISLFTLPATFLGAVLATVTLRLRSPTSSPSLRYGAAIIAIGVFGVIWYTATDSDFRLEDMSKSLMAIASMHLITDFMLLTSVLTLGAFSSRLRGLPTRLVVLGVVFYMASDIAFILERVQNQYRLFSWSTIGAIVGPMLLAVAPMLVSADNVRIRRADLVNDIWALTYLPLGSMCVLLILESSDDPHQMVTAGIVTVMILLLIGRIQSYKKSVTRLHVGLSDDLLLRERELLGQQLLNERIIDVAADGIVAVGTDDRVVLCNRAAREILLIAAETTTPEKLHDLFHRGTSCTGKCDIDEFLHRAELSLNEVSLDIDGEERVIEVSKRALDGPESGFVLVFHDVTDRARLARVKERIVSVVSHEIRTPLTSIRGSLGLIDGGLMGPISPEAKRMIAIAVESSERLMRLINDLLDVERIESGRRTLDLVPTPLNVLLADAVTMMQPIADARSVDIEFDAPAERGLLDRDRILQVLTNLIQNSIKFSNPGSTIHLLADKDESHTIFTIRDEGHGIPASHIDAIFEPFHQVDVSDSGPSSGSGLGLAICKEIVTAHGGTIWAERGVENGAVFKFRIPNEGSPLHPTSVTEPHSASEGTT